MGQKLITHISLTLWLQNCTHEFFLSHLEINVYTVWVKNRTCSSISVHTHFLLYKLRGFSCVPFNLMMSVNCDEHFSKISSLLAGWMAGLVRRHHTHLLLQNGFTIGVIALQRPRPIIHAFPVSAPCKRRFGSTVEKTLKSGHCCKQHWCFKTLGELDLFVRSSPSISVIQSQLFVVVRL